MYLWILYVNVKVLCAHRDNNSGSLVVIERVQFLNKSSLYSFFSITWYKSFC